MQDPLAQRQQRPRRLFRLLKGAGSAADKSGGRWVGGRDTGMQAPAGFFRWIALEQLQFWPVGG